MLPLLVMLTSLTEHLGPSYRVLLYLLHQGLSDDVVKSVSRLVETCSIVLSPEAVAALPRHAHFPPETACPLLLPELLPQSLERVLFLDADLLVLDDVAQLWETPVGERALAAAPDAAIPLCCSPRGVKKRSELGIAKDAVYFNCGVMVIQLAAWRKREVSRRAYSYLQSVGRRVDFLHQEALNAILWDDWQPLDSRWNLLGSVTGRPYGQPGSGGGQKPGIVHFAGRCKPWRAPVGGPFNAQYCAVLTQATRWVSAAKPTLKDKLLSLYDRHLRNSLYNYERALWTRGLL